MSDARPARPAGHPGFLTGIVRVVGVDEVGPRMRCVRLHDPGFASIDCSDSPASGCRVLIPGDGQPVVMPTPSLEKGLVYPDGVVPMEPRTLTIRRHDPAESTLDVEVTTSHPGVLAQWALTVAAGDEVGFAGPRHFAPLPAGPLVLLGDESALPAIASIVEQRQSTASVTVVAEVSSPLDELDLGAPTVWLHRDGAAPGAAMAVALTTLELADDAVVWIAGESGMARRARDLVRERPAHTGHIRASGYWRSGTTTEELDRQILEMTQQLVRDGADMEILDEFALAFES